MRKHDWESTTKKASNRSWDKVSDLDPEMASELMNELHLYRFQVYVVAKNARLTFFKDQKASKSTPESTFRGELPLVLDGANVDVEDYKKRKHVFRLKWVHPPPRALDHILMKFDRTFRLANGNEFLLQAHDDAELNQWVSALKGQCQTASGSESRSQTLPATSQQRDESKKRSFFTLKKK